MNKTKYLFSIIIFSFGIPLFSQNLIPNSLDYYLNNIIRDNNIPGLSISIIKGDSILYIKGFGVKKHGEKDIVNTETLFQVASVTKSFTATLIAKLVDQSKLKWDDPVIKYLPNFKLKEAFITNSVTIRDLLAFQSGILGGDTLKAANRKELLPLLSNLNISPQFRIILSSYGCHYAIAGLIVENVKKNNWKEIVRDDIFIPLEMHYTFADLPSALSSTNNIANPHTVEGDKILSHNWEDFELMAPSDAIISNVQDLSNWIKFELYEGTFNNKSIIKSDIIKEMQKPQAIAPDWMTGLFNPNALFTAIGLGFIISEYNGHKVVEIWGASEGSNSLVTMIPDNKFGIVILANSGSAIDVLREIKYFVYDHITL